MTMSDKSIRLDRDRGPSPPAVPVEKTVNDHRLHQAVAEFTEEVQDTLAKNCNGRVSLTLHLSNGQIAKPEIQRNVYPNF